LWLLLLLAAIEVLSIGGQAQDDVVSVTPLLAWLELLLTWDSGLGTCSVFFDLRELLSYKRVNNIDGDFKVNHLLEHSV
jgi:hypothetical protein